MSRTAAALLDLARADGIEVYTHATGIKVRGPSDAVARWIPLLRPHKPALLALLTGAPAAGPSSAPPPLTPADRAAIAERIEERAAIQEHDAHLPRPVAEQEARAGMRVYRVLVAMGKGEADRWVTMLAPQCDLTEATRAARGQFGPARVLDIVEQERRP